MSSSFRSYIRLTYFLYLSNAPGTGTSTANRQGSSLGRPCKLPLEGRVASNKSVTEGAFVASEVVLPNGSALRGLQQAFDGAVYPSFQPYGIEQLVPSLHDHSLFRRQDIVLQQALIRSLGSVVDLVDRNCSELMR